MCKSELISCGATFEDPCPLSVQARDDLQWVIHNIADHNGLAHIVPSPDITSSCSSLVFEYDHASFVCLHVLDEANARFTFSSTYFAC